MKASIYNGIYNSKISLSDAEPRNTCANATWPIYNSLAICASTSDVTAWLRSSCSATKSPSCNHALPNGTSIAGQHDFMSLVPSSDSASDSIAFAQTNPVVSFYTFFISNQTAKPVLLESALHLCIHSYNTTVTDGKTKTDWLSSSTSTNWTLDYVLNVPDDDTDFVMSRYSFNTMTAFLRRVLQGRYQIIDNNPYYETDVIGVLVNTLLVPPYDMAAMSIFLNGLATSMTNT